MVRVSGPTQCLKSSVVHVRAHCSLPRSRPFRSSKPMSQFPILSHDSLPASRLLADARSAREKSHYAEAARLYEEALDAARRSPEGGLEPRILSALARTQFERGQYGRAVKTAKEALAIMNTSSLLEPQEEYSFNRELERQTLVTCAEALFFSERFREASWQVNAYFEKGHSAQDLEPRTRTMFRLLREKDCIGWWTKKDDKECRRFLSNAEIKLSLYRPTAMPQTGSGRNYSPVGTRQRAVSALEGILQTAPRLSGGNVEGVPERASVLDLQLSDRESFNFFYGGCGDCQNVFMTLYDIGKRMENLQATAWPKKFYFLLNDKHPAIIARTAILLVALQDLAVNFSAFEREDLENETVLEHYSFLHFVFASPVIPYYLQPMLVDIMKRLIKNPRENVVVMIDKKSLPAVVKVLEEWLRWMDSTTPNNCPQAREIVDMYRRRIDLGKIRQASLDKMETALTLLDIKEAVFNCTCPEEALDRMRKPFDECSKYLRCPEVDWLPFSEDIAFWALHRILPPPARFAHRHSKAVKEAMAVLDARRQAPKFYTTTEKSHGILVELLWIREDGDAADFDKDYLLNVTGLDPFSGDLGQAFSTTASTIGGCPPQWNPFSFVEAFFGKKHSSLASANDTPFLRMESVFDVSCEFWGTIAKALSKLLGDTHPKLMFELVTGDMNGVAEYIRSKEERKQQGRPSKFLRAFVGSIPEITSLVCPFLCIMPILEKSEQAFLYQDRLRLHPELYSSYEAFVRSSTCLRRVEDSVSIFGAQLVAGSVEGAWWRAEESDFLLPRSELEVFLEQQFFETALPPTQTSRDLCSHHQRNLATFVQIVAAVRKRGAPSHWIAGVLEDILENRLITSVERLEGPDFEAKGLLNEKRHFPTKPFVLEMRGLLSLYGLTLRVPLRLERPLPSILTFVPLKVTWDWGHVLSYAEHRYLINMSMVITRESTNLMLNDVSKFFNGEKDGHVLSVFEWKPGLHSGLLTARLWISKEDIARLKRKEGSYATICRMDSFWGATRPVMVGDPTAGKASIPVRSKLRRSRSSPYC